MGDDDNTDGMDMFYQRAEWEWTFAWLPHRCDRTRELIWLRYAYRGTVRYESLLERLSDRKMVMERRWLTTDEFIIGSLKGTIA
jgi:hypothetical protein